MILFTDFVPGPETKYDLAWKFIYLVAFDICVNLILLVFMVSKDIVNAGKVRKAKSNAKKALNRRVGPNVVNTDAVNPSTIVRSE